MEIITYSLRCGRTDSDQYYHDITAFTDEVLKKAEEDLSVLLGAFEAHLQSRATAAVTPLTNVIPGRPQCVFELLALGVFWRLYVARAVRLNKPSYILLAYLAHLKQNSGLSEYLAKLLRRLALTLFLPRDSPPASPVPFNLSNLKKLLDWLEASGNFLSEAKRLRIWADYLATLTPSEATAAFAGISAFTDWFETRSENVLGNYTSNVNYFLSRIHPSYRWREDVIFTGRQLLEYHLNMVGTEILNRAFREAFLKTEHKLILLPPCMTSPQDHCQAYQTRFGAHCAACTPGCRVHQITRLGEKYGFQVLMIPDQLSVFSSEEEKPARKNDLGIVGVSCVLTNTSGGWDTQTMGIPAQGVLLDYCGCPWHWHKKGFPTDLNINQLIKVLGVTNTER